MRYRLRTFITVTAASALLLGGAVPGQAIPTLTTTPEATESAQPSSYDGGDLFRGLLLGYGPVVDQHPALARGEAPSGYQVAGDRIIATIDEADPTFLEWFAAEVTSGDRARTERALTDAHTLLAEISSELAAAPADAGMEGVLVNVQINLNFYVDHMVYIHQTVLLPYLGRPLGRTFDSQLDWERWINTVAATLG